MICEKRLAQKGEAVQQREIWKDCFGDPDSYIDFYYANRYKEEETALLLHEGQILAMLTMIPVKTVFPDNQSSNTAMFYAIATKPQYQNRGFAAQLINYSNQLLGSRNELSVLVPANKKLFAYYRKLGYQDGFYLREILLKREGIDSLSAHETHECMITPINSEEYNARRIKQLGGRFYISYADNDVTYQKKLSQQSGADIYAVDIENIQGCLIVERIDLAKVFIKEILIPDDYLNIAIKEITQLLPAKEYVVRTPTFLGKHLGGVTRCFGMIKVPGESDLRINTEEGYLGIAYD